MPFINGRYHINPVMGEALEAAREAEAALLALQQRASRDAADSRGSSCDDFADADDSSSPARSALGPVRHVEIAATELVPSASGRATRGFVARVHRLPATAGRSAAQGKRATSGPAGSRTAADSAPAPETHVFTDHRDLVNYLRDELARK